MSFFGPAGTGQVEMGNEMKECSIAAVPELPAEPAKQLDPERDRHRAAVLQHPGDLHGQPHLLAREHQRGRQGLEGERQPARPGHDAQRIRKGTQGNWKLVHDSCVPFPKGMCQHK